MPGLLLHERAAMQCPHGGTVMVAPAQTKVLVSTMAVATSLSQLTVVGCLFQVPFGVGTKPQPCVIVQWANVSGRVKIYGSTVMLQATPAGPGGGVCKSVEQIPAGPPIVQSVQQRVLGT